MFEFLTEFQAIHQVEDKIFGRNSVSYQNFAQKHVTMRGYVSYYAQGKILSN